jgi:uncharacterized membrane protein HdeD (DUF308 family)
MRATPNTPSRRSERSSNTDDFTRSRALLRLSLSFERQEVTMIVLGVILLLIGYLTGISILWTIGIILLVVGLVLMLMGRMGHAVGGRRHYF